MATKIDDGVDFDCVKLNNGRSLDGTNCRSLNVLSARTDPRGRPFLPNCPFPSYSPASMQAPADTADMKTQQQLRSPDLQVLCVRLLSHLGASSPFNHTDSTSFQRHN